MNGGRDEKENETGDAFLAPPFSFFPSSARRRRGKALNIDGWQRFQEKGRLRSRVAGGTFLILGHKNYKEWFFKLEEWYVFLFFQCCPC